MTPFAVVSSLREQLTALATTEGRLLATATILLLAALAVRLLAPWAIRSAAGTVRRRAGGRLGAVLDRIAEAAPWQIPLLLTVRAIQILVVASAAFSVLVVWGQAELANQVLSLLLGSLPSVVRAVVTVVLIVAAWIGSKVLEDVVEEIVEGTEYVNPHQEQMLYRLFQLTFFVLIGFSMLTVWQIDLSNILVGAGVLGVVLGFAARQTLGSLVAGIVLMFSRPFEIGDWVEIGEEEGIVMEITIITTRLRSFDGEHVSIANDRVADAVVRNLSREGTLRLQETVTVDYDADPEHASEVALEAIREVDAVVNNPSPHVVPVSFENSGVRLSLRYWIDRPTPQRKWRATRGVLKNVKAEFASEGIKIPVPRRELSGRAEAGGVMVTGEGDSRPPGPGGGAESGPDP